MRNLKKVLALVVALTFVLSTVAFAAPTSDIENDNVKEAVERLYYFGIVNGKDDGLYHADENLTREQFAKLVVEAMGLGAAAEASGGDTGFTDVAPDRWSAGYIQVASGKGIIKGKGDGTFDPEAGVTYPEAVTMLVRSLGYKDEFLTGAWPSNYVGKAAELDIPLGAKYSVNGVVDRGAAAVLVDNTLDAKIIEQSTYGDENNWEESDNTLLESKLDFTELEDCTITATNFVDDGLDEDEVTIDCEDDDYDDDDLWDGDYTLLNQSASGLLGVEGTMYINDDDEIIYFDVTDDEDDIITGWITDADVDDYAGDSDNDRTIKIQFADGDDEEYEVAEDVEVYVDNETESSDSDDFEDFAAAQYGTFLLNGDGEIDFAVLYEIDDFAVIQDIDTDDETVEGYKTADDNNKIDLAGEDGYKLFKDGAEISFDDLEVGDVIMVTDDEVYYADDNYMYGFVVTNTVTGELDKAKTSELTIDDTAYDVYENNCGYSLDLGDSLEGEYNDAELIEDAIGEDVTAFLDLKGEIVYFESEADVTSDVIYGIVTRTNEITSSTVKILNGDGEEIVYDLDDDAAGEIAGFNEGDIVAFELDSDGTIDYDDTDADSNYEPFAHFDDTDADDTNHAVSFDGGTDSDVIDVDSRIQYVTLDADSFDDDNDYIKVGSDKFYIGDDTKLLAYYDDSDPVNNVYSDIDPYAVDWDQIKDKSEAGVTAIIVWDDDKIDAEFVVFLEGYEITGDVTAAYLTDDPYKVSGGDWVVDVVEADGTEVSYVLDDDDDRSALDEGDFVLFDQTDSGKFNSFDVTVRDNTYMAAADLAVGGSDWAIYNGEVSDVSGTVIKLAGTSQRILSSTGFYELVIDDEGDYDEINEIDSGDIDDGDFVQLVVNEDDGELVMVIKIDYDEYDIAPSEM